MTTYRRKLRPHLRLVHNADLPKVAPVVEKNPKNLKLRKPKNEDVLAREEVRLDELERLIAAASCVGRYPQRDELLLLMMYHHGLRVCEATKVRWSDIDWEMAHIHIKRMKRGKPATHPIYPDSLRLYLGCTRL